MPKNSEWYAPVAQKPLDRLDQEILKIGLLHGDAMRNQVAISPQTLTSIRKEFHKARKLSHLLSPVQRLIVCDILNSEEKEQHLQDILLNVLSGKNGTK